jgi:hypothetical protein
MLTAHVPTAYGILYDINPVLAILRIGSMRSMQGLLHTEP